MSTSLLTTTIIILSEISIVLIALCIFLFLRLRKASANSKKNQTPAIKEKSINPPEHSIQTYIDDQIARTTNKLEEINDTDDERQQLALACRLSLLNAEKRIIDEVGTDNTQDNYWDITNEYYQDKSSSPNENNNPDSSDPAMLAQIKKLEVFKGLFVNTQNKLKDSFDTINDLKNTISEMHSDEENAQIEDMVDKLSIDNINLHKQLDNANQQLKSILADVTENTDNKIETNTSEVDTENNPHELSELKEENDFLTSQIQHLLKQELGNTRTLKEQIAELETNQQEKTALGDENEELKEENEFLSNQIQFLLQQEIQASKAHLEKISELETTIEKMQAASNTSIQSQTNSTENNEEPEAIDTIDDIDDIIEKTHSPTPDQQNN